MVSCSSDGAVRATGARSEPLESSSGAATSPAQAGSEWLMHSFLAACRGSVQIQRGRTGSELPPSLHRTGKAFLHFNNCKQDVSNLLPWHWVFFQPLELFYIWPGCDGRLSSSFRLSRVITLCNLFPSSPHRPGSCCFLPRGIQASISSAARSPLSFPPPASIPGE